MFPDAFIPLGQVPATANRLQRAAGELRERSGSPNAVPNLPVTLAHLEEAFDQLAVAMRLMAQAAAEWCQGDDCTIVDERSLPAEARALLWHLRVTAETLIESRDGCTASREWAGRLLEHAAIETDTPCIAPAHDRGGRMSTRPRRGAPRMGGRVHGTVSRTTRS
ncbi:MAG: hypothetical protein ABI611_11365 [Solirubrobacteraceae bacterium]